MVMQQRCVQWAIYKNVHNVSTYFILPQSAEKLVMCTFENDSEGTAMVLPLQSNAFKFYFQ